jgi:predicted nucleic acid-binding protein
VQVLYDTSVLIVALLVEHANHNLALPMLELAQRREVQGYLSTHSLAELYAVMTRLPPPLRVLPAEAVAVLADLTEYLEPVPLVAADYQAAIVLMAQLKLTGGGGFDAVIAQAALKAGVDQLVTLNPKDFIRLGKAIADLIKVRRRKPCAPTKIFSPFTLSPFTLLILIRLHHLTAMTARIGRAGRERRGSGNSGGLPGRLDMGQFLTVGEGDQIFFNNGVRNFADRLPQRFPLRIHIDKVGNTIDPIVHHLGQPLLVVNVEHDKIDPIAILPFQSLQIRRHRLANRTPFGIKL